MRARLFEYSNRLREDARETDLSKVKEAISQLTSKWKIMRDRQEGTRFGCNGDASACDSSSEKD